MAEQKPSGVVGSEAKGRILGSRNSIPSQDAILSKELANDFKKLYEGTPGWAWNIPPSIPLIGKDFCPRSSMLVYASAENFSWMNTNPIPKRYRSEEAWNRYRAAYEDEGRFSNSFFPDVGIQPVSDGGLLTAGLFLACRYGFAQSAEPRDFLEKVAVSNWCKFTVKSKHNSDYVTQLRKLNESLPYVVRELAMLEPAAVLLPQRIWNSQYLKQAMRGASPYTRFIPALQFNSTVVNCRMGELAPSAARLRRTASATLKEWMAHLRGLNRDNAWRYLASLNTAIHDSQQ